MFRVEYIIRIIEKWRKDNGIKFKFSGSQVRPRSVPATVLRMKYFGSLHTVAHSWVERAAGGCD